LASIGTARAFTLATLARWGISDAAGDAAAVMSELLTNALRHALPHAGTLAGQVSAWPIRLGLLQPGPCVVCAVADPSPQPPVLRHPSWEEESGRGLQVVASLASQWGYCADPGGRGKVVWAAFATASRPG
jgi:two-component sensor histidine kinase